MIRAARLALLAAGAAALVSGSSAAHADTTCQAVDTNTVCVSNYGDPANGTLGVHVSVDGPVDVNLCLVVFESCPPD